MHVVESLGELRAAGPASRCMPALRPQTLSTPVPMRILLVLRDSVDFTVL